MDIALVTASSSLMIVVSLVFEPPVVGVTFYMVCSTTRLIVWVTLAGASARSDVVIIPVAIEVTKLIKSVRRMICVLVKSSMVVMGAILTYLLQNANSFF